jgi:hypothetical protein
MDHYKASLLGIGVVVLAGIGLALYTCKQQAWRLTPPLSSVNQNPETISLAGTAQNAAAGAVIITDSGDTIYIDGLASWPDTFIGTLMTVTGQLSETKYIPDALPGGGSTGAEGLQKVLKNPLWSKAP